MGKVCFVVVLWLSVFQGSPAIGEIEAVFSPGRSLLELLLKEIESTASTLDLALHEMTAPDLAEALVKAKQRGVKVRVVTDSKQAKIKSSKITSLIHQGIPVKVLAGKGRGVMNHRFVLFDGKRLVTGSYGWAETSGKWDYENILILSDPEVITSYQKEFERLWREKRVIQ